MNELAIAAARLYSMRWPYKLIEPFLNGLWRDFNISYESHHNKYYIRDTHYTGYIDELLIDFGELAFEELITSTEYYKGCYDVKRLLESSYEGEITLYVIEAMRSMRYPHRTFSRSGIYAFDEIGQIHDAYAIILSLYIDKKFVDDKFSLLFEEFITSTEYYKGCIDYYNAYYRNSE